MKSHTGLSSFYLSCERAKAANFVSVLLSANCKPRFLLFGYGQRTDISLTTRGIRAGIPQELDVVAFQSWKLDAVAFCPLKKKPLNHNVVAYLSPFLDVMVFSPRISMLRFSGLGISLPWFFGLGIPISRYICLHGLVFVVIVKTKKSRIIISITF